MFNFGATYNDTGSGFVTHTGFFRRPDYRTFNTFSQITWHPKGGPIYSHGPTVGTFQSFDHQTGTHLSKSMSAVYDIALRGLTSIEVGAATGGETLRPLDFASLPQNQYYSEPDYWVFVGSDRYTRVGTRLQYEHVKSVNFTAVGVNDLPPVGNPPNSTWDDSLTFRLTLRPVQRLLIDNNYTWERLRDHAAEQSVFNNHIIRTKANYQITRALSLRFIETYQSLLTNPLQTTLKTTKGFNTDFLLTYLVHPGTAVYVGYNSNLNNLTPNLALAPDGDLARTRNSFINDERQFFVKISYLFRF
jgi:hypothetical protein